MPVIVPRPPDAGACCGIPVPAQDPDHGSVGCSTMGPSAGSPPGTRSAWSSATGGRATGSSPPCGRGCSGSSATTPEHAPPYAPGDRVRCVVSTVEDLRGRELLGRVGTVDRCLAVGDPWDRGWDVTVARDGVLPRMPAHHDPLACA